MDSPWHVFIGLCSCYSYLYGYIGIKLTQISKSCVLFLHHDIGLHGLGIGSVFFSLSSFGCLIVSGGATSQDL